MTLIDQYIFSKPDYLREVLDFLNQHILCFDPSIKSTIKWKVPYYSRKGPVCYLNVTKDSKVELNFTKAFIFDPNIRALIDFRGRTVVGGILFKNLEEIDVDTVNVTLQEAIRIDNV